jgi:hypothetical protein
VICISQIDVYLTYNLYSKNTIVNQLNNRKTHHPKPSLQHKLTVKPLNNPRKLSEIMQNNFSFVLLTQMDIFKFSAKNTNRPHAQLFSTSKISIRIITDTNRFPSPHTRFRMGLLHGGRRTALGATKTIT